MLGDDPYSRQRLPLFIPIMVESAHVTGYNPARGVQHEPSCPVSLGWLRDLPDGEGGALASECYSRRA